MTLSLDLGGVVVHRLIDIPSMRFQRSDLIPDLSTAELREFRQNQIVREDVPDDVLTLSFGAYLVISEGSAILVDSGIGDTKHRSRAEWHMRADGALPRELARLGYTVSTVDTVYLTHLHADHVGWNTIWNGERWQPTFPHASYLTAGQELTWAALEYSRNPSFNYGSYADSVEPLLMANVLTPVDFGHDLSDRVSAQLLPGHTPGSSVIVVRGDNATAVLSGDLIHHPVQCGRPDLSSRFCCDARASTAARTDLLSRVANCGAILMPAHFIWGQVVAQGAQFEFLPLAISEEK